MSAYWLERLRNAHSQVERDEILLRDFRDAKKARGIARHMEAQRLDDEVEEQIRTLADLALGKKA